MISYRFIFLY